jgi:hypothetical protein
MDNGTKTRKSIFATEWTIAPSGMEPLESRQLLSGMHGFGGRVVHTIEFSQAPSPVQTGLNTLATNDNLSAPTATQKVFLGNSNGVELYTIDITGTGTDTRLTVDINGDPVTAPTRSSTTFGAISSTAVTDEFNLIATALGATAPASTDSVRVSTPTSGPAIYTLVLSRTTTTGYTRRTEVSVDANGNPTGNELIPFSAISTTIQNALNANAPSGATAIDPTSTQRVSVRTLNGVTSFSVRFNGTGTTTTVTVNAAGQLTNLPSTSTDVFSNIPSAAQTELQTLATADGVSDAIATTQNVKVYDEANGTVIYSVTLAAANTSGTGTHNITLSVDENGNPTVPPNQLGFGFAPIFGGFFGRGLFGRSMFGGCGFG